MPRLLTIVLLALLPALLSCASHQRRQARAPMSTPALYEEQQDGPTGGEEPELTLGQILAPSLRGMDEVAEAPPMRPERSRPSFSWRGSLGQRSLVGWAHRSESVGSPNGGRLARGFELERKGPGWFQRGSQAFGTDELVAAVHWAVHHVKAQFPATAPVFIGDLSAPDGGTLRPHRSHQSGRDVDIGYYLTGNRAVRRFVDVNSSSMDVEKTWALLEGFFATGMVQYVFIDYDLQPALFDEARRAGWSDDVLGQIFQYPRGRFERAGVIRHAKGHDDHFHLRIHCPPEDERCQN